MALFSACSPFFRPFTDNSESTTTYKEEFYQVGKMIETNIGTPQYKEGTLYADDGIAENKKIFNYVDITLNISTIPNLAASAMFGATYNKIEANNCETLVYTEKTESNYGAYGFLFGEVVNGEERYGYEFYPRVKFDVPSNTFKTAGENIEFSTPTISGRAYRIADDTKKWRQIGYYNDLTKALNGLKALMGGTLQTSSVGGGEIIPTENEDPEEQTEEQPEE